MGSLDSIHARVGLHPLDTVLSLVWRQLPAELLWQNVRLVRSEDPEGVDDLLGSVHVRRLPGHEVQEAVELDSEKEKMVNCWGKTKFLGEVVPKATLVCLGCR